MSNIGDSPEEHPDEIRALRREFRRQLIAEGEASAIDTKRGMRVELKQDVGRVECSRAEDGSAVRKPDNADDGVARWESDTIASTAAAFAVQATSTGGELVRETTAARKTIFWDH